MGKQAETGTTVEYVINSPVLMDNADNKGYLNARILIHRPFLASVASQNFAHLEANIDPCLDAARKTIELLYESYAHRLYFRTWWAVLILPFEINY